MSIELIKIDMLLDHPENETIYGPVTADPDLVQSITERGILQPLRVTSRMGDFQYIIISGHRRKTAAKAAGLEEVPCEVISYGDEAEELIDLIHSNKHRTKTDAQINEEISRLRSALSDEAKRRQTAGLTGEDSSLASIEANGKTDDVIAEKTGVSRAEVQRRTVVSDSEYRQKFYGELRKLGGDDELIAEIGKQWAGIHRQYEIGKKSGGLSLSDAAQKVKDIQQEFRALCPKFKPEKKAAPKGKKKPAPGTLPTLGFSTELDDDTDTFDVAEYIDEEMEVECGILKRGAMRVAAIRKGSNVVYFDWKTLFKNSPAKKFA